MTAVARRRALASITAALALVATGCGGSRSPGATLARGGSRAPDFTVDTVAGETFRLADHLGKDVVVLDFWTTFCQPCIPAIEHLNTAYAKHKGEGLVVVGVAMDPPETAAQIVPFVRAHALAFTIVHDAQSRVTDLYNKKSSMPYQVLIGRDGRVRKLRESYQPGDEVGMEQDIVAALAEK